VRAADVLKVERSTGGGVSINGLDTFRKSIELSRIPEVHGSD
jgi:hypothetical protein